jgi:CheY-like chemotaxis protein
LHNPQQFWEVFTAAAPDLLLVNLELPVFSGIELCQVVRQDSQWKDLPILLMTEHTDIQSIQQVFAAGANDFIQKPVEKLEVVTRIVSRLYLARS